MTAAALFSCFFLVKWELTIAGCLLLSLCSDYMAELRGMTPRIYPTKPEAKMLESIEKAIVDASSTAEPIDMVLVEPLNVKDCEDLSHSFLSGLRRITSTHGIYLAADEVMTGLKCPARPLLSLLHRRFQPDFVTIGKSFLLSGVLAWNKKDEELRHLRTFIGETTSAADSTLVYKSMWLLKQVREQSLLERIADLDQAFLLRFAELGEKDAAFVGRGFGLLWKVSHPLRECLMPFLRLTPSTHFPVQQVATLEPIMNFLPDPLMTQREVPKDQLKYYSDGNGLSTH